MNSDLREVRCRTSDGRQSDANEPDECTLRFPSSQGSVMADPRLPRSRLRLLDLVITRGTPPRLEGCRPASRGLALALMTDTKTILLPRVDANGSSQWVDAAAIAATDVFAGLRIDTCPNPLDNVASRTLSPIHI